MARYKPHDPICPDCGKLIASKAGMAQHSFDKHGGPDPVSPERRAANLAARERTPDVLERGDPQVEPDWSVGCEVCGQKPTLPLTGMCGPCTFGEAETVGGNW